MISISHLFAILLIHYLADAGFQMSKQAKMKSEDTPEGKQQLLYHVIVYSSIMTICGWILLSFVGGILFGVVTAVCHYYTDYYTSRWSKAFFAENNYRDGFIVVLGDQLAHHIQLIWTYSALNYIL